MPIPKPYKDELHDEFIKRCVSDDIMVKEYKDTKQRYAVCQTSWDNKKKLSEELLAEFEPPDAGNAPQAVKDILKSAYTSCRLDWVDKYPDDKENAGNKTKCAKIAWATVENAGWYKDNNGVWKKKVKMADIQEIIGSDYVELDDIEILNIYPNSHNIKFTKNDLMEIKNNFDKLKTDGGLLPIIKISHSDQQMILKKLFDIDEIDSWEELPLLGVVDDVQLSKDGNSLRAKIARIPAKFKDVFGKMFKAVSPEIVFNWRGTGQKVLRAVALTNMPSQKHITDVALSEGLSCGDIIIIDDEVKIMGDVKDVKDGKDVKFDETFIEKLADKISGVFSKKEIAPDPSNGEKSNQNSNSSNNKDAVLLSLAQYNEIKNEMNELKKKLLEKDEQQKNFSESIIKMREQARIEKAEAVCSKALNDGVPKVVIDKLKPLLISDIGEHKIKLSKVVDEKTIEAEVNVFELVKDFFTNYPGQKIDFTDKTVTELSAPSEDKMKLVRAKAQEYMKQGLSEHESLMRAGQDILK